MAADTHCPASSSLLLSGTCGRAVNHATRMPQPITAHADASAVIATTALLLPLLLPIAGTAESIGIQLIPRSGSAQQAR